MTCGIYMIQNKVNGKIYIGQAVDIENRWQRHKGDLRGNYHINKHLQRSWNTHDEADFEFTVICECDENQLNTMEEYYIFELMSYDYRIGYNNNYGGSSGRPTEETRKKISEAHKGRPQSEEHRKKNSEVHKGITPSEETRKKMSEVRKGKNNPFYGKHHTEETRKKISEAHKGENSHMYGKRGFECPNSIPIVQLTKDGKLIEIYGSAMEAERGGFNSSHIGECSKSKRKTHKGYKWMYLSDYEAMKKED